MIQESRLLAQWGLVSTQPWEGSWSKKRMSEVQHNLTTFCSITRESVKRQKRL